MITIKNLRKQLKILIECLDNNGVICFPTETVCALACDATKPAAIDKLYTIKSRNKSKAFSILLPDIDAAKKIAEINSQALALMQKFSPGPITYVLLNKSLANWPKYLGIRIPNHPIAELLLKNYPNPLVGTSTNISGQPSAKTVADIPEEIMSSLDAVVHDSSKTTISGLPSTVVNLAIEDKDLILRAGQISKSKIII